mmetsp:Transcript_56915/g.133734  ORF Transcript_56915/g.133734 Transcript_56915/m.133734 type:complete len:132 (+) Transcript_56915:521-916(+)
MCFLLRLLITRILFVWPGDGSDGSFDLACRVVTPTCDLATTSKTAADAASTAVELLALPGTPELDRAECVRKAGSRPVLSNLLGGAVRLAARKVLAKEPEMPTKRSARAPLLSSRRNMLSYKATRATVDAP